MSASDTGARPFCAEDFSVPNIYLDSAARHPLPVAAGQCLTDYGTLLTRHDGRHYLKQKQDKIRALFARLINAETCEIGLSSSTTMAEQLLLLSLDLPRSGATIITDQLHFSGSLALYEALAREGASIEIIPHQGGSIDYSQLEKLLDRGARLVALSSVSHYNGFCHDLKTVCEMAHARGALVYADIIQEAGALPVDVRESGVDFCACNSYKWLLGDLGLGFIYIRKDLLSMVRRPGGGPHPEPLADASNFISTGSIGGSATEILCYTLPRTIAFAEQYPAKIWRALTEQIEHQLCGIGMRSITPPSSPSPIRAFVDARLTKTVLQQIRNSGVRATGREGYLRLSPSVFNTAEDIDMATAAIRKIL